MSQGFAAAEIGEFLRSLRTERRLSPNTSAAYARDLEALGGLAHESTGSSTFVARALVLDQPPSLDAREITDKGSINQKVVLQQRAALVDELYAPVPSARVLIAAPHRP